MTPAGATRNPHWGSTPLELGYDAAANARFEQDVRGVLRTMAVNAVTPLCLPLTSEQESSKGGPAAATAKPAAGCDDKPPAAMAATVHVMMLRDGAIWRIASSFAPGIDKPLVMGSTAKAVLALPVLALDNARADERWCERTSTLSTAEDAVAAIDDGRSPDMPPTPCPPGVNIAARKAFAESRNAALIDRMRGIPAEQIREHLASAQVQGAAELRHPAVMVPLGLVDLTPRQTVECFDALASGQSRRAAFLRRANAGASAMARWCAAAVSDPRRKAYVHTMLRAPAERGGTAEFATLALSAGSGSTLTLLAKTGTPSDARRRDLGKTLLVSFETGGHRYTALLAVVSPSRAQALALRLPGDFLAPLLRLLAQQVQP